VRETPLWTTHPVAFLTARGNEIVGPFGRVTGVGKPQLAAQCITWNTFPVAFQIVDESFNRSNILKVRSQDGEQVVLRLIKQTKPQKAE
jgi:hypothetical protein